MPSQPSLLPCPASALVTLPVKANWRSLSLKGLGHGLLQCSLGGLHALLLCDWKEDVAGWNPPARGDGRELIAGMWAYVAL